MNGFALYLIKSVCWLTGFALVFLIFLRNERFFMLKRIFLITGIMASFFFPLLSFHYHVEVTVPVPLSLNPAENLVPGSPVIQQQFSGNKIDFMNLLLIVYLLGLFVFAASMIHHIILNFKSIYRYNYINENSAKIIRTSEYPSSFSFFNYVFINPSLGEKELREIMNHELVHIKQKHWLDLLLVELLRLLQWANPFIWIYIGLIKQNHEYLADEEALKQSSDPTLYKAALLNHVFRSPVISLTNSFNYYTNKNRFEMMKKIITSPYRKLKVLFIFPVFAILFYAFSEPQISYSENKTDVHSSTFNLIGKEVKGVVMKPDGNPFQGVQIAITGTDIRGTTDGSGKFNISEVPEESHIIFSYRGYLTQVLKPKYSGSMAIKLLKDPEYTEVHMPSSYEKALIVIDEVISNKSQAEALREMSADLIARMTVLRGKDAIAKYGEKGNNGVIEIITRKKAAEMGLKIPVRRTNPEDYPTFQGENYSKFSAWLAGRIKYPEEDAARGVNGRVTVSFTIQPDGSLSSARIQNAPDKLLGETVIKALNESPRWEPAKNTEVQDPFQTSVTLKFDLPDKITPDDTYVAVEQMPEYPGGDASLLDYIKSHTTYPEGAKADKAEGKVIVRFVINTKGGVEDAVVLKGVHPLLDAEALRIVSSLTGWLPGAQGGKPVNVWYMVPITFTLPKPEPDK
jgi:TonB family protein